MSAFCGVFQLDGQPVDVEELNRVSDKLALWKPDKTFQWREPNLGVTQWLYYNTPESVNATFPTTNHSECYVLASNTRLDNRAELAEKFHLSLTDIKTFSDEDFLLLAYNKWGEDCSRYLLGDFAFVIWDAKKQQLFLTRDQVGHCKAIYYYYEPNKHLIFGSNIRPVYEHRSVPIELNDFAIARHLIMYQPHSTQTFYKNIFRLPTGHHGIVNQKGFKLKKYRDESQPKKIRYKKDEEYIEHFNEVFFEAVRCCLRSYSKIGSHLSGGLDSSSVSVVAAKILQEKNQKLNCFGAVPHSALDLKTINKCTVNDSLYMQAVADKYPNIYLTKVVDDYPSIFTKLNQYLTYSEIPNLNPYNRPWLEIIFKLCVDDNIRCLLTGEMGNLTISWKGPYACSLFGQMKFLLRKHLRLVKKQFNHFFDLSSCNPSSFVNPLLAKQNGLFGQDSSWSLFAHNRFNYSELIDFLDLASIHAAYEAMTGVEARDPTADLRVIKFCTAIPSKQYYNAQQKRLLIRRAMEGILPDKVRLRETTGLQGADWYLKFQKEHERFDALIALMKDQIVTKKYFDVQKMQDALSAWPNEVTSEQLYSLTREYAIDFVDTLSTFVYFNRTFK